MTSGRVPAEVRTAGCQSVVWVMAGKEMVKKKKAREVIYSKFPLPIGEKSRPRVGQGLANSHRKRKRDKTGTQASGLC